MSIHNPQLLQAARHFASRAKEAFVDGATAAGMGDPSAAAMGGDPMAGPMPPMPAMGGGDPMAGGGDPMAAAGGDPAAAGGGGEDVAGLKAELEALKQQMAMGGGGAGMKPEKPKVDVNTEIYQIKKLLVMIAEQAGISVPASMLLGDPAQDPGVPNTEAAKDPFSAAATQAGSAISPIDPMQGASPALAAGDQAKSAYHENGQSFNADQLLTQTTNKASALRDLIKAAGNAN